MRAKIDYCGVYGLFVVATSVTALIASCASPRPVGQFDTRVTQPAITSGDLKLICSDQPVVEELRSYLDDDTDVDLVSFMTDVFLGRFDVSGFSLGTAVIN